MQTERSCRNEHKRNNNKKIKSNEDAYKFAVQLNKDIEQALCKNRFLRVLLKPITGKSERLVSPLSVREYCDMKNIHKETLEEAQMRDEYEAACFEKSKEKIMPFETPDVYYCKLSDIFVLGMNDGMVKDGFILNDRFGFPCADRMNFNTECVIEKEEKYIVYAHSSQNVEEAISLLGTASNNYYHWCFDILSKMAYINMFPELRDVPLLLDRAVSRHSSYMELLKLVDRYKHPIIFVERGNLCHVAILHYFSPCTFSNVYWKRSEGNYENALHFVKIKTAIDMYRKALVGDVRCTENFPLKIFISRGADKVKRLVNEEEVANVLKKSGFEIVDPGMMSIKEQAQLFHAARWIIGDEGAALVNAMYGGSDTTVVCIMPLKWHNRQFTTIAHTAGVKSLVLDAEETGNDRYHKIDMDYLKRFIDQITRK